MEPAADALSIPKIDPLLAVGLRRLDTAIKNELDLIAQRIAWLVVSQTFLFSAFSTALSRVAGSAAPGTAPGAGTTSSHTLHRFVLVMPVLGMLVGLLVLWAVVASHHCIKSLREHLQSLEMQIPGDYHDNLAISQINSSRSRIAGFLPFALPALFFLAWCYLLAVHALA